jgi:hypothetical protein
MGLLILAAALVNSAWADRRADDQAAKAEFLQTNFFADGRGMHDHPGEFDRAMRYFGVRPWNAQGTSTLARLESPLATSALSHAYGLNEVDGKLVGFFDLRYENIPVGVIGCAVCHSGKAAGIFIPGLGNKNIDNSVHTKGGAQVLGLLESPLSWFLNRNYNTAAAKSLSDAADRIYAIRSDPSFVSPTQGLIENNVVYRTFYESFGLSYPEGRKSYLNKVPQLWGIGEKRKVGKFLDGAGDGFAPGWTVAVEIMNGQTAETIREPEYQAKIHRTESLIAQFLPPPYPFQIDVEARKRGEEHFQRMCFRCHGNYAKDEQGLPVFVAPKLVPVETVGTDPTRSEFFRYRGFWAAAENSSFRGLLTRSPNYDFDVPKYFAPRLDGVWARFPYLHNASVPSLWAMLHPDERPEAFVLADAGERYRFDPENVGLTLPASADERADVERRARQGDMDVYWTQRPGQSNQGHRFGANLTDVQKRDLIEYLKSL